jgi:hypothetical protein
VGDAHADLAGLDIALGQARMDLGDIAAAGLVVDAVARSHAAAPQRNMLWAQAEFALAEAQRQRGDAAAAAEHYAAAREAFVALAGADHPAARECARRSSELSARGAGLPD